jgi:hypothetical protein
MPETTSRHGSPTHGAIGILIAVAIGVSAVGLAADWAGDLAKKAVGHAAREGIEEALRDEAFDETLEAAARGAVTYLESERRERYAREDIGEAVTIGVEVAMRAAEVAETLDDAADVAETMKKVNKIRKAFR